MTREEWQARLPLIQAFVEGKIIQYMDTFGTWVDARDKAYFTDKVEKYRIKPEPKVIWVSFDGGSLYASVKHYPGMVKYVEVVE